MIRKRPITYLAGAALLALSALSIAACGGGGASASVAPPKSADGHAATLGTANTGLGKILVDSHGRTLYLFGKDSGTTSLCTGACAQAWPPLKMTGKPTVGTGTNAAMVGTTTRSHGGAQVTYNGHPLYRYQGDQKPGDTNGQGLTAFGGRWSVISPAGQAVTAAPANTSNGNGY